MMNSERAARQEPLSWELPKKANIMEGIKVEDGVHQFKDVNLSNM